MRRLKMLYRLLADCVVLAHVAFVAFVALGGFLTWRWRGVVWAHVPCALWGIAIEYGGWVCPLTPLENALRAPAGLEGNAGGLVEHCVIPCLAPAGALSVEQLTPPHNPPNRPVAKRSDGGDRLLEACQAAMRRSHGWNRSWIAASGRSGKSNNC